MSLTPQLLSVSLVPPLLLFNCWMNVRRRVPKTINSGEQLHIKGVSLEGDDIYGNHHLSTVAWGEGGGGQRHWEDGEAHSIQNGSPQKMLGSLTV